MGTVLLGIGLTGCGGSHGTPSAHASAAASQGQGAVHLTVDQGQGHLTVRVSIPPGVSAAEATQLQSEVRQLNRLLQQLQNP